MSIIENSKTKLTYEDYVGFPEDGRRHEVIDGDHYVTPSPSSYHQSLSLRLAAALLDLVERPGHGRVFTAPMDVLLTKVDIVQPDIMVVSKKNAAIITEKNIRGSPELLVEILSSSTSDRDRNLKKSLYQRSGVREYWIVDPDRKRVEQHVLASHGAYDFVGEHHDTVSAKTFAGLAVDLGKVW